MYICRTQLVSTVTVTMCVLGIHLYVQCVLGIHLYVQCVCYAHTYCKTAAILTSNGSMCLPHVVIPEGGEVQHLSRPHCHFPPGGLRVLWIVCTVHRALGVHRHPRHLCPFLLHDSKLPSLIQGIMSSGVDTSAQKDYTIIMCYVIICNNYYIIKLSYLYTLVQQAR